LIKGGDRTLSHDHAEALTVRPVGAVTGCELVARTGRHEVNWLASDTADLTSYGLGADTDVAVTISLARCRACEIPLLLLGGSRDEAAYSVVWEVLGGTA
jgi:hypothetical protein